MADDAMWCLVMFDVPSKEATQRRDYTKFRNLLLDLGFSMDQLSVYSKYSPTGPLSQKTVKLIKSAVPAQGSVSILHVTDREWASTIRFRNAKPIDPEDPPTQLAFF